MAKVIKKPLPSAKKVLTVSLSIVGAVFVIVTAVLFILYKFWSNKAYFERWKDYEDCGV